MATDATRALGLVPRFAFHGRFLGLERCGNGHINDTCLVRCDQAGTPARYILQRINRAVFTKPEIVVTNIANVLGHIAARNPDADARSRLTLVPTRDGAGWVVDDQGDYWRSYLFVERTRTVETVSRPSEVAATARAFARLQKQMADYQGPPLGETIPDFHHTPKRLDQFKAAVKADAAGRLKDVRPEVDWILGQERLANLVVDAMASGAVPKRITHNDTKINNVLFDAERDEAICVIDLDTLMPGSSLYDFGDLVRTATATVIEDEADLSKVDSHPDYYKALADGWLQELDGTLTKTERELLPVGGALITYEQAVRFLGDHIAGDVYYKIKRPGHNLDRARNQIALAKAVLRRHVPDGLIR